MKFDLSKVKISYVDRKEGLTLPQETSVELAEFIGILAGDGHVGHHTDYHHSVEISGHKIDDIEYYQYVKNMFVKLFNLNIRLIEVKNQLTIKLKRQSVGILSFLELIGYKKIHCIIKVPDWIWLDEKYSKAFIKGLFDTDGSLPLKKNRGKFNYYPVMTLMLKDKILVKTVSDWLKEKEVPLYFGETTSFDKRNGNIYERATIQISGFKNVGEYVDLIGISNPKNIKKWKMCLCGFEPPITRASVEHFPGLSYRHM